MRAIPIMAASVALASLAAAPAAQAQTPALSDRKCEKAAHQAAKCFTLTVPLDRSGATPGTIALPVQVLRARGARTKRGPLIMLAGGPGQAGLAGADQADAYAELAPGYDIVSFDQRGTGRTALRCDAFKPSGNTAPATGPEATRQHFAACAAQLGARQSFFRTTDSAADIEDLRIALGAAQLTLGGTSYGTWVAQV